MAKRRLLISIAGLVLIAVSCQPTTHDLEGTIEPEYPISNRRIALCQLQSIDDMASMPFQCTLLSQVAVSNEEGHFEFSDVPDGVYIFLHDSGLADFDEAVQDRAGQQIRVGDSAWLGSEFQGHPDGELHVVFFPGSIPMLMSCGADFTFGYLVAHMMVPGSPFIVAHEVDTCLERCELFHFSGAVMPPPAEGRIIAFQAPYVQSEGANVGPTDQPTSTSQASETPTNLPPTETPTLSAASKQARQLAEAGVIAHDDWESYKEVINGVEMALVPAGCFQMGSDEFVDAQPIHEVCFDEPFWIDVYEVTLEQYRQSGYSGATQAAGRASWYDSLEFCEARGARLPTEAEWEYAARGPDSLVYPWGNDFIAENVVYEDNSDEQAWGVGSKPGGVSWIGAHDLSGNVSEWVSDWYDADYYGTLAGGVVNPQGPGSGSFRGIRGGSWNHDERGVTAANRGSLRPTALCANCGFRCALSYNP